MDLLNFLKEKKSEVIAVEHPYMAKSISFKYLYCLGLSVLAIGHLKAINEIKSAFNEILESINLPLDLRDKFIIDINNNFDHKLNEVLDVLNTKEKQYTFTADLFRLSSHALWSQQFCENVTDTYMSIFKLTNGEREFLRKFSEGAKRNNNDFARDAYNSFIKNGYRINYKLLKYMSKNFVLEDSYQSIKLLTGESLILDKPTEINGNVYVTNGSELIIDHADIKIKGSIHINGGRLTIKKGSIFVLECNKKSLITIENTTAVSIYDTVIDCNFKCGFIKQDEGFLSINSSVLLHSKFDKGIQFSGKSLSIANSTIEDCLNGGIHIIGEASLSVVNCNFYNCEAEQGGGIYSDSINDTLIADSHFKSCKAKYIGGAVYFAYKKYGQEISECEFDKCMPEDSVIFNQYINI